MMFKHYILIRFNQEWLNYNNHLDTEWMLQRLELFKKYTLPSLLNQTNQNFEVCFGVHSKTNKEIITIINDIFNNITNINILIINKVEDFKLLSKSKENYIITTRLDDDDMLHKDFVNVVQNNFLPKHKLVLNPNPIIVNYTETNKQYILDMPSNQFTSLIEESNNIQTIYYKQHTDLMSNCKQYKNIKHTNKEPLACFNVHKNNTGNYNNKYDSYKNTKNYKEFNISNYKIIN